MSPLPYIAGTTPPSAGQLQMPLHQGTGAVTNPLGWKVQEHPEMIREYLVIECSMCQVLGPFNPETLPQVQVSRFGVISKSTPNKW